MGCNAVECPNRNCMGYCMFTACSRLDLFAKYNKTITTAKIDNDAWRMFYVDYQNPGVTY